MDGFEMALINTVKYSPLSATRARLNKTETVSPSLIVVAWSQLVPHQDLPIVSEDHFSSCGFLQKVYHLI